MSRYPDSRPIRRPVLAPGLRVLARAPGELQIGLSRRHRLVVADTPQVRRVLSALDRGEAPRDAQAPRRILAELAPVLRDGQALVRPGIAPEDVAATILRHPDDASDRLDRRHRQRVAVLGDLGAALDATALLRRCGLGIAECADEATVVLLLVDGEPDRADLDPLLRHGIPHLLLRAVESEVVLGPFVVPGRTACLRCLDAHELDTDLQHPALLAEYLRSERHDGVASPIDSALATVAVGWAASDLIRFAEEDRPTTWSATMAFSPGQVSVEAVSWLRHPGCGCSWGVRVDPDDGDRGSVTMGA
jgi:bacteriocin biosynthesis cyclodehydratase domain-containing protein